ncbi:hypothetical protein OIU78_017542 [Salix suchowensis]|nr:hypothetical protein OIU78_017542 [Salix suchowensis]
MQNPNTTQQSRPGSWAEKVRVSDSSQRCHLEPLARQPMGTILNIPEDMLMTNVDIWERSMVGFFVSYKMPYHAVCNIANRVWKKHGLEKVTVMENGFMLFRFASEESMQEVLAKGPWMFGGKTILLQQWTPGFKFDKNKIRHLPVWARLQGLPFPMWTKQGLSMAASMLGKPIACDDATIHCSRLDYARLCIEIDASMPLVHQFQVTSSLSEDPITVEVSYEWKPARCSSCRVFGHSCPTVDTPQPAVEAKSLLETVGTNDEENLPETVGTHGGKNMVKRTEKGKGKLTEVEPSDTAAQTNGGFIEVRRSSKKQATNLAAPSSSTMGDKGGTTSAAGKGAVTGVGGTNSNQPPSSPSNMKGKGVTNSTDSLQRNIENRMVSINGDVDSRVEEHEVTRSNASDSPSYTQKSSNSSPSPKASKKRKGKKKKGAHSPR